MRTINFSKRNFKEIVRDPISLIFSILLPLFLLFIFQQFKIPSEVYKIENFTPGIIIFGFSFITLFTSSLVSSDRSSSLLARLCASPMKSSEYILGYILSVIPMILIQIILFFIVAIILGLSFSINIIFTIIVALFISILFISLGIIIGCITTPKASSGVSSIVVQLVAFTSGMYFSSDMVGKFFSVICDVLPFSNSLNIIKGILNNTNISTYSILITILYIIISTLVAIILFKKKMMSDNKSL